MCRLLLLVLLGTTTASSALEKWVYVSANLLPEENLAPLEALITRAHGAGYTHVFLQDSKFGRLATLPGRYFDHARRVRAHAEKTGIEIVPAVFPLGYSSELLFNDPHLIEPLHAVDTPLVVAGDGRTATPVGTPALPPRGFADFSAWSWHDPSIAPLDGTATVRDTSAPNARICKKLTLPAHQQFRISVDIRTVGFTGKPEIKAISASGQALLFEDLETSPTSSWTRHHVVFNTLSHTGINIYFGCWGAAEGTLQFRDPVLEPVPFLNIVRRPGAPLNVRAGSGTVLAEGTDFDKLTDPEMGIHPYPGEYRFAHAPPVLKLTKPLEPGTRLLASYYHAATVLQNQAMICPSEPASMAVLGDHITRMHRLWEARTYFMSHDEIRVLNHCAACKKRGLTPGQILASNARTCTAALKKLNPGGRIVVWSDMFDPHHNAIDGYYLVDGTLEGSWEGLSPDIVIAAWHSGKAAESLDFFAGRGHPLIIAGYYDEDPGENLSRWLEAAKPHQQKLQAIIYTTWQNDYSNLETFSNLIPINLKSE